mmetsp:Transcript_15158/g.27004  ORF Transcript_15158/g.27004 Transcript_15158/m.27004 type:complete len:94 (-) Transcript_15158:91-372(-)
MHKIEAISYLALMTNRAKVRCAPAKEGTRRAAKVTLETHGYIAVLRTEGDLERSTSAARAEKITAVVSFLCIYKVIPFETLFKFVLPLLFLQR